MGLSLWWSFSLTLIGVTGLVFVYAWKTSKVGPLIGLAVQGLWIAYAFASGQWWFLVSAFTYGGANIYGLSTRKEVTPLDELAAIKQLEDDLSVLGDMLCAPYKNDAIALYELGYRKVADSTLA